MATVNSSGRRWARQQNVVNFRLNPGDKWKGNASQRSQTGEDQYGKTGISTSTKTNCCWRLCSHRTFVVSFILEWQASWLHVVVKARSQVLHMFLLWRWRQKTEKVIVVASVNLKENEKGTIKQHHFCLANAVLVQFAEHLSQGHRHK
jgi:hypothetical protein